MADAAVSDGERLLAFVHVPKTAGTAFTAILSMNEPGERTRHLGNVFKGGGGLDKDVIARLRTGDSSPDLRRARIVTGHFPLGIREHLPRYSGDRQVDCFSFLRDPIDRTLSHFFAIRERRGGSDAPTKTKLHLPPLPAEATLDQALERGYVHDNVQTRMLSGLPEPFGEVTEEMLERAKRNLREELVFFGLTERFDESLVLARRRLGLRSVLYKPAGNNRGRTRRKSTGRVSTTRPRGEEVPGKLLRAAERCNRYDIELYRCARELFDRALERTQLDFEVELAALRAAKVNGAPDLDIPAPAGFGGDREAWRMLLDASAASLRHERELAEIRALTDRLGQGDVEILEQVRGIRVKPRPRGRAGGRRTHARDADAAAARVSQLLGMIAAALRAGDRGSASTRAGTGGAGSARRRTQGSQRKAPPRAKPRAGVATAKGRAGQEAKRKTPSPGDEAKR